MKDYPNKLVSIAGGSGSGKSTLAIALCKKYPERIALVHLDDYFKKKEENPIYKGMINWDHPDGVRFNDLYKDLISLLRDQSITVRTKSELYNPEFSYNLKNKIHVEIQPKPIIILEGYLALYDPRIRSLMDLKIYLDMPISISATRRSSNKITKDPTYLTEVLIPMYHQYVEPTKLFADKILDADEMNQEQLLTFMENELEKL